MTYNRPNTVAYPRDKLKDARVLGVLSERHAVGQDDYREVLDAGCADTLDGSPEEEHGPVLRCCAERAPYDHEEDAELKGGVTAEDVGELAEGGDECGRCQCEGGDDPVELVESVLGGSASMAVVSIVVGAYRSAMQ
jgi:hypothetical protein